MAIEFEELQETYPGAGTFKLADTAEANQAQIALVRNGVKTATCGDASEFDDEPEAMPVVGRCDVIANWDDTPALVIRTTKVEELRFCDVSDFMALSEGHETLLSWRKAQKAIFRRQGHFDPEMRVLFEHFEVVEDLSGREL